MQTRTSRRNGYRGACPNVGWRTSRQDHDHEAAMTEKPRYRGRRHTSSRLPVVGRTTARCGAITTFIALTLFVTTWSAMAAPSPTASLTGASVGAGDGTEAFLAPLRQS